MESQQAAQQENSWIAILACPVGAVVFHHRNPGNLSFEERVDDISAVMDAAGIDAVVLRHVIVVPALNQV